MTTVGDMWIIYCVSYTWYNVVLRLASVCHAPVLDVACCTCCSVIFKCGKCYIYICSLAKCG